MARLNYERQLDGLPSVKPCEIFDLIGGTSTGGFVCATDKDGNGTRRLQSHDLPGRPDNVYATICDAALASSAATSFFDLVTIGTRTFVDGTLWANNPVDEVKGEVSGIWCQDTGDLKHSVKWLISIGTGKLSQKAIAGRLEDEDWYVRRAAINALRGQSNLPEAAVTAIIGRLEHEDRDVRRAATDTLRGR